MEDIGGEGVGFAIFVILLSEFSGLIRSRLSPFPNVPSNLVQSATGEEVGSWKGNSRAKLSQAAFAFSIGDVIYATVD